MNPDDICGAYINIKWKNVNNSHSKLLEQWKSMYEINPKINIDRDFIDKVDVAKDLPDDAVAKLNLLHGDCAVIPKSKLKDLYENNMGDWTWN